MNVVVKERPDVNLRELLVFCSCDCSCIRFSLWKEEQNRSEPKYIIYMNYYSSLNEKPHKYCRTEFKISLESMSALVSTFLYGWDKEEIYYNSTKSVSWKTAMVWRLDEDRDLIIGFYPKKAGSEELYQKDRCLGEIILQEPEREKFLNRMHFMVSFGHLFEEKWRKGHAISSHN